MIALSLDDLHDAAAIVHAAMPRTPQFEWPLLSARLGFSTLVKHEAHTPVGAFKIRGGFVYMDRLVREGRPVSGLFSATRGNHGQSIALAGARHGLPVTIVVPHGNSAGKNDAMRSLGARLIEAGDDFPLAALRAGLSRIVEVSDAEIAQAMRMMFECTHQVAEGAGAAALAAAWQDRAQLGGRRVGIVHTGGNVDRAVFAQTLQGS